MCGVSALAVFGTALWIAFFPHAPMRQWHVNPVAIEAAARAYAADLRAKGLPVPDEVPLTELVERQFLRPEDIRGTEGTEVRVALQPHDAPPTQVLVRATLPSGQQIVLLNDGSVQESGSWPPFRY